MTQICAIAKTLLNGEVLSVMNCFKWFGCTNCAREIGRHIERKFGVVVTRSQKNFTSRYGQPGNYYEYRLLRTPNNKEGIERMEQYISENEKSVYKSVTKVGPKVLKSTNEVVNKDGKFTQLNLL